MYWHSVSFLLLGVGCKSIYWHSVSLLCGSLMRLILIYFCLVLVIPKDGTYLDHLYGLEKATHVCGFVPLTLLRLTLIHIFVLNPNQKTFVQTFDLFSTLET
jgi:hypothetical protein